MLIRGLTNMATFEEVSKQWKENPSEPVWCEDESCQGAVAQAKRFYDESRTERSDTKG